MWQIRPMPVDHFSASLLDWYDAHGRALPWRTAECRADPYAVWLAEIMAQQTTLAAVIPYWRKFLARWPTVEALAAAPVADILREWAGLGYYARARNLARAAEAMAAQGAFPRTARDWQALPGVGPYAAAAIAAIAFEDAAPVIDTNVARVLARLHMVETPWPASRRRLETLLAPQIPATRRGDFAEALMDLGALVCTPSAPDCGRCPLQRWCQAQASGHPQDWPPAPARKERPLRHGAAWWIECGDQIALVRRPARGMLGGMLALPGSHWQAGRAAADALPFAGDWHWATPTVRHVFTHFELRARLASIRIRQRRPSLGDTAILWRPRGEVLDAGLPTLYLKLVKLALQREIATK